MPTSQCMYRYMQLLVAFVLSASTSFIHFGTCSVCDGEGRTACAVSCTLAFACCMDPVHTHNNTYGLVFWTPQILYMCIGFQLKEYHFGLSCVQWWRVNVFVCSATTHFWHHVWTPVVLYIFMYNDIYSTVGRSIANIYDPRWLIYQGTKRWGKYAA